MIPIVSIVGRPNVGKSTLLNRLARRRVSIVHGMPGVTRDRVSVEVELDGRQLELVDTGGLGIVDRQDLHPDIHLQIDAAIESAALILFVVDARTGPHPLDEQVADRLRRQNVPVRLIANKCESEDAENGIGEFYALGLGDPLPLSAQHGQGIEILIESVLEGIPDDGRAREEDPALRIAIVGRRNSGKSTFTNALLKQDRVIVSEIPGTTRDAVDVRFQKDGLDLVAIDTAGILRKAKLKGDIEYYAQVRSLAAIRRADVVIFLLDALVGVAQVDKRIAAEILKEYRPCVIAINKWDLVKSQTSTEEFTEYLSKILPGLYFAPCVYLTALEGKNVLDTVSLAQSIAKQARGRAGTGEINRALEEIRKGPVHRTKGGSPKIYFGTQISSSPPTLVLFVNKPTLFAPAYRRFIENQFRELLDFQEIPLKIVYRKRTSMFHE